MRQINYELQELPILKDFVNLTTDKFDSDNSGNVQYKFNEYGYRSSHDYKHLLNEIKIVCIGCSFTQGVGLQENETWPYLLSKKLKLPFVNLGLAAGSQGYVSWQIKNTILNIQKTNIFVLKPPKGRIFNLTDTSFKNIASWDYDRLGETHDNLYDLNDFILDSICKSYDIKSLDSMQFGQDWGKAKDDMHYDVEYQNLITKEFLKLI